jgi:hypothetical protein
MSTSSATAEAPWRAGLHSARATLKPGLLLIAAAVGVVVSYYRNDSMHAWLEQVAVWRQRGGFAFAATMMAVFAGVLPFLYLRLERADRSPHPWPQLLFLTAFWAYKGIEVDLLYRGLTVIFGSGHDWLTVGEKMLCDQLLYNPLFAAPYGVLLYAWKDAGFHWAAPLADLRTPAWYHRRILPVMIAVWVVWIPAVCCIYALPLALQIPLNTVINCFWVILFSHLTSRQNRPVRGAGAIG